MRALAPLITIATLAGCATGFGHTGAGWGGASQSETYQMAAAADQKGVAPGYERMTWTGRILTPSNGIGLRYGLYGGYKYGRQFGSYSHSPSGSGGIAAELHLDGVIAWSRAALIVSYGQVGFAFDKPEDALDANQLSARVSYALSYWFSINAGAGVMLDTKFTRDNKYSNAGSGHRLIGGADLFLWQNWFMNIGVRVDASLDRASAPFMDGTSDTFSGETLMIEPYLTFL